MGLIYGVEVLSKYLTVYEEWNKMIFENWKLIVSASTRFYSEIITKQQVNPIVKCPPFIQLCEKFNDFQNEARDLIQNLQVHKNFLSEAEEATILEEIEPYMKRLRYEFDHWDDAIHGYRETERLQWNEANTKILDRVRKIAFPPNVAQLKHVHILDLAKDGYIKPHIDAVRFCGDTIAGLSLLTDGIMRLVHDKNKDLYANILLKRRSLYIMKNVARYDYTHEILSNENSIFKDETIFKDRRISVICRNEPNRNKEIP